MCLTICLSSILIISVIPCLTDTCGHQSAIHVNDDFIKDTGLSSKGADYSLFVLSNPFFKYSIVVCKFSVRCSENPPKSPEKNEDY